MLSIFTRSLAEITGSLDMYLYGLFVSRKRDRLVMLLQAGYVSRNGVSDVGYCIFPRVSLRYAPGQFRNFRYKDTVLVLRYEYSQLQRFTISVLCIKAFALVRAALHTQTHSPCRCTDADVSGRGGVWRRSSCSWGKTPRRATAQSGAVLLPLRCRQTVSEANRVQTTSSLGLWRLPWGCCEYRHIDLFRSGPPVKGRNYPHDSEYERL